MTQKAQTFSANAFNFSLISYEFYSAKLLNFYPFLLCVIQRHQIFYVLKKKKEVIEESIVEWFKKYVIV